MNTTQHRLTPWSQVMGADDEKIYAYGGQVAHESVNRNAAVGFNTVDSPAVPAGEIWVITNICAFDANSAINLIRVSSYIGLIEHYLSQVGATAAGVPLTWNANTYLKPGDFIRASFDPCVAGDDIYLRIAGYKMVIP